MDDTSRYWLSSPLPTGERLQIEIEIPKDPDDNCLDMMERYFALVMKGLRDNQSLPNGTRETR